MIRQLLRNFLDHVGDDVPRAHAVDATNIDPLYRKAPGKVEEASLGCVVLDIAVSKRYSEDSGSNGLDRPRVMGLAETYDRLLVRDIHNRGADGGGEDDVADGALLAEVLGRAAGAEPRPVEVDAHGRRELVRRAVLGGDRVADARVGHQDVEVPKVVDDGLKGGLDGGFVAHVALVRAYIDLVVRRDLRRRSRRRAGAAIDDGHRSPGLGERLDDLQTNASRSPCLAQSGLVSARRTTAAANAGNRPVTTAT